ncbi:MAG: sulfite exporter TauE/SafE family protein [Calditrichaeota bacterium]|nr:sulfite exporter TauE/SafE family protein [Calditrichota bacterium]
MHSPYSLLLLFGSGLVVGFINVMAGGGSSLTLPLLIFLGLDSSLANGTNRLAILVQNLSAVVSFRREKIAKFKTSLKLASLALPGAIIGSIVAVRMNNHLFEKLLAVVIIGIMLTMIFPHNEKKFSREMAGQTSLWMYPVMVAIGFYGGFLQVGVGFMLMASLQNLLHLDLIHVNMHKVFIIFFYTIPALVVFILTKNVDWLYGIVLSTGMALGGYWSAKVSVKKGEKAIRIVLLFAMFIMAMELIFR